MSSIFFLFWLIFINKVSSDDCNEEVKSIFYPKNGCQCSYDNQSTELVFSNCKNVRITLNSRLFSFTKYKTLITINTCDNLTMESEELEQDLMSEITLFVQGGTGLMLKSNAFNQIIINAVFKDVKNLQLSDKSFASCWGNLWFINLTDDSNSSNTIPATTSFSSSDITVWKSKKFTRHIRPTLTPLQKFKSTLGIADKIHEIEITIYAVLAVCASIVIALIALTVCVAAKFGQVSSRSEFIAMESLPDSSIPGSPVNFQDNGGKIKKNPVIKVSRVSKVFQGKRNPKFDKKKEAENRYQRSPRPPLPLPKEIFE